MSRSRRVIDKRGGWWKCRDGEDAKDIERDCQVCHNKMIEGERNADVRATQYLEVCLAEVTQNADFFQLAKRGISVADRLASLLEFMAEHMKKVGETDKDIVLARIRAEGFPQYLGTRTVEEERFRNPVLSRTGSMPSLDRHHSMDSTTSLVSNGSPIRSRSPVRYTRY